jgi:hypothetical protein
VAEELVKQGYATWEKGCKEQQRIVDKQSQQPQTASSEDVSAGKEKDEGVDPDEQNRTTPENCKKCVVQLPEGFWDEHESEGALEMG